MVEFKFRYTTNVIDLQYCIDKKNFIKIEAFLKLNVKKILKFTKHGIVIESDWGQIYRVLCNKDYQDYFLLRFENDLLDFRR
jgi:hypothetical protein